MKDLRRLSDLVAEHIMGECRHDWQKCGPNQWNHACTKCGETAGSLVAWTPKEFPAVGKGTPYPKSISAAWQVVEKMREQGWDHFSLTWGAKGKWDAMFMMWHGPEDAIVQEVADTAPLAICLAALRAKGVEVPEE